MLGFSIWELFTIGVVALVVLGPERLPRTARTIGALVGKAQRYVSDVKSEVNRAIDLEELKKMKTDMEDSARDVQHSMQSTADDFEKNWAEATSGLSSSNDLGYSSQAHDYASLYGERAKAPKKNWRVKRAAMPLWYKQRNGIGRKALSGAARVARYRPKNLNQ